MEGITPTEADCFLGIYLYTGAILDDASYKKLIKDQSGLRSIRHAGMKEFMYLFRMETLSKA